MARLTVFDYNHNKVLFRLAHHPDCKGATYSDHEDGESLIVTAPNGVRIRVHNDVDWLHSTDGEVLDDNLGGAFPVFQCLLAAHRTVDTEEELEDMVCELYRSKSLEGMGTLPHLLEKAFMFLGMGWDSKIGFRNNKEKKVPRALRLKCNGQLYHYLENDSWDWGSLTWIPLKELVKLVYQQYFREDLWKLSKSECVKSTLFDHYQTHGKLANRYAEELQRRFTAWSDDDQWPEVA